LTDLQQRVTSPIVARVALHEALEPASLLFRGVLASGEPRLLEKRIRARRLELRVARSQPA
jgi:hypothetical protein